MYQAYRLTVFILVIVYGGTALGQCDCEELFCTPDYQPCADTEVMSLNETVVTLTEELAEMNTDLATMTAARDTAISARDTLQGQLDTVNSAIAELTAEKDTALGCKTAVFGPVIFEGGEYCTVRCKDGGLLEHFYLHGRPWRCHGWAFRDYPISRNGDSERDFRCIYGSPVSCEEP